MNVNPVLYFHPDGYRVDRADLKGRHSAGESFLSAFLAQSPHSEAFALCDGAESFRAFSEMVAASGRPLEPRHVTRADIKALAAQGLVHLPHPLVAKEARLRGHVGDTGYALCGVTHTIASREVLDGMADLVTAPVMPWDAIVLTSRAVQQAVAVVLDHEEDRLRRRIGAQSFTRPLLPVIPLGLHASRFTRDEKHRARWRAQLGLGDDTVAVLFFGRLSVHAKASPFQLAAAVEQAARRGGARYAVVWCGWFSDDFQQRVFMETAKRMAPSVEFHHVDGRAADARFSIWSAADIFCSLSDNLQETFGLTVIEAMAAELPVVVSNWDGYRDTVDHGVTGVLIDSYTPDGSLADLAYRYAGGIDNYDQYIGGVSQFCFVDVEQVAGWIERLAANPDLRRSLGSQARRAAETRFDWHAVLPRYQELWNAQRERLEQARRTGPPRRESLDPARVFAYFGSHRLSADASLERGPHFDRWTDLVHEPGIVLHAAALLDAQEFSAIRDRIASGPQAVGQLVASARPERRATVLRSLHWMVKIGLLRIQPIR